MGNNTTIANLNVAAEATFGPVVRLIEVSLVGHNNGPWAPGLREKVRSYKTVEAYASQVSRINTAFGPRIRYQGLTWIEVIG